jgi:hypothetical protein
MVRLLAWRPRLPRWFRKGWSVAESGFDPLTLAIAGVVGLALLPFLLWYVLSWLAALVATPFVWAGRAWWGRPIPVVAFPDDDKRAEFTGSAPGTPAADALVDAVCREIIQSGTPRSLLAPTGRAR